MLIGHTDAAAAFRAAAGSDRLHHAWLLAGPAGIGKRAFAEAAATWLLARTATGAPPVPTDQLDVDPEHPTARLIAAGSHMDLRRLERTTDTAGKVRANIRIDEVRALQPLLRGTPALGTWRVIIVDALDDLNRAAANALLKNLEEPPPATLFLGLSHSPGRLLPTLRSRCRTLRLQPLADADVARILEQVMPDASVAERAALVTIANGSPGQALRFAGAGIEKLAAELASLAAATAAQATARAFALAKGLAAKPAAPRYEAFLELAPSYIATAARSRSGARLARALGLWDKAHALGSAALGLSLDPQSVVFELSTLVAGLADK